VPTGFIDQLNGNQNFLGVGVLQPGQISAYPAAQQIGNLGTAEVDYQFNRNSTIGASTNSYISHIIKMLQPALTLVDTQSAGGGGDPVSTAPILM
jgi:hypothetical protein